jgi:hypothetical protein
VNSECLWGSIDSAVTPRERRENPFLGYKGAELLFCLPANAKGGRRRFG